MAEFVVGEQFKSISRTVPIGGVTYEFPEGFDFEFEVPAGSVDKPFVLEFDHTKLGVYCLSLGTQSATQSAAHPPTFSEASSGELVVKVNSITTPAPTITIDAKMPHSYTGSKPYDTNEFSANVTEVFISNAGLTDLWLLGSVGLNS